LVPAPGDWRRGDAITRNAGVTASESHRFLAKVPAPKALTDAGGKFLVRGGETISYQGAAPAPRVVVIQFESLDKLQALYNSAPYKDAVAVGDKYATQRIFGAEGVSP
jgi:uncharacterized protein (DUF1330 family)